MVPYKVAPHLCFHEQIVQNKKRAAHSLFSLILLLGQPQHFQVLELEVIKS